MVASGMRWRRVMWGGSVAYWDSRLGRGQGGHTPHLMKCLWVDGDDLQLGGERIVLFFEWG